MSNLLPQIRWENRYMRDNGSICLVTVDGTDFRIFEPRPFSAKWYSHKFHGPGVRYEVGICIQTGWIVWINGPFPCGAWADQNIALNDIVEELDPYEVFLADGVYSACKGWSETPNGLNNYDQRMKQVARARHEHVNGLFKNWSILNNRFRQKVTKHGNVFWAIANITQAQIQVEGSSWQVQYYDNH